MHYLKSKKTLHASRYLLWSQCAPSEVLFLSGNCFRFKRKAQMSKKQYTKPPLPLDEQAQLLLDRGLKGISKEDLIQKLENINYYRLRGYTYPYQNNYVDNTPFFSNSKWEFIWNDYIFDSKLRNLVTDALGHIEVSLRTQLELEMSLAHGSRWYTDLTLAYDEDLFNKNLEELKEHWNRSREIFKEHYETEYVNSLPPPAWMIFETTTFGTVSKIYSNIKKEQTVTRIRFC